MDKMLVEKAVKIEQLLDRIEENRLLALAADIEKGTDTASYVGFDKVCRELGFDPGKIESECESVEIE